MLGPVALGYCDDVYIFGKIGFLIKVLLIQFVVLAANFEFVQPFF